ncbi:glycosyltransferase family 2 protein [Candidatus Gottesmanbacteria bacterium]|nr:glycosyltransferase family 2 protein [Candidatus Gottesmanbacteria bacterium]
MNTVSVVIVHYKNTEDTMEAVSVLTSYQKKFSTIIIANSPLQGSQIIKKNNSIHIIEPGMNTGFSQGNNLGIKKAMELGSQTIILINNDTIFSVESLEKLITFAYCDRSIGIVSPKIYFAKGYEFHKNRYKEFEKGKVLWYAGGVIDWNNMYPSHNGVDEVDHGQYERFCDTDFATGCCMLVKREVIETIGLFDEKYFLYFEDVDYSLRARREGFRIMYDPSSPISHKNASSSGKPGSRIHRYYLTRNRLYFAKKFAPFTTRKSLMLQSFQFLLSGSIERQAVFDYYIGRMGRGSI